MANVEKFKYWCNKILPLVYDDSLSYYEFLGKVYEKLNETIDAVNSNTEAVAEFDQRINDFIAAETAARESWEDQQERDRQSWETTETANRAAWENQQALKWSAFQAMFISEYDPDDAYVKGDLCSVQYKMYVANASTTGTFDPTKWDEIVLSDYLAAFIAGAAEDLQNQYDAFLETYQREFGIVDALGGSVTDAISDRAATAAVHSADFMRPGLDGDITGHYYAPNGTLQTLAVFNAGNLIPCRAGQVVYGYNRIDPESTPFYDLAITFWDANGDFVTGIIAKGSSFTVPNNSDIRFMRCPYNNTYGSLYRAISFWPITENPPAYYDLHTIKQQVDKLPALSHVLSVDTTKTLDAKLTTDLIHSADLLYPGHDGDITGKYYCQGSLVNNPNFNAGNLIPCEPGQTFYYRYRYNPAQVPTAITISFFNAADEFVTDVIINSNTITVPANTDIKYMRTPYNNTYSESERVCVTLTNPADPTTVKPFYNLHTVKAQLDNLIETATDGKQWNGKTWYAYGTSITSVAQGKYVTPLAAMLGATTVNKGIPGGGIGNLGAYSTGQVYTAICNTTDGKLAADLITLETGANDVNANVPLGTIYDTGTSTLAGCLNDCIRYLQTNTTAQVVIIESSTSNSPAPNVTDQVWKWRLMMRDICKINCVTFIPIESNVGYAKMTSGQGNNYLVDAIHQTELGGYVYAEAIFKYLKNVPTFKTTLPG